MASAFAPGRVVLGDALFSASLASGLAAIPAAARCASDGAAALDAWVTLWCAAAVMAGPAAALLRMSKPWPRLCWAVPIGAILSVPVLTAFGRLLYKSTHHRPLGAVTLALVGGILLLGLIVASARLLSMPNLGSLTHTTGTYLLASAVGMAILAESLMVRSAGRLGSDALWAALDGLLLLTAMAAGTWCPVQILRIPWLVGPLLWTAVVVVGGSQLVGTQSLKHVLWSRAPTLMAIAGTVLPW